MFVTPGALKKNLLQVRRLGPAYVWVILCTVVSETVE